MYANSDVYISRNISYNTSGWGAPGDIPSFKLVVVGGNIYIGAGVTKLDGIYAAELKAGVGGGIYTCAKGNSLPWNPSTDYATGYYQACKQQLVVTGAFIAKTMHFLRTYGSVGQSSGDTLGSNHAGEVFQYTPELWLPRGANVPDSGYDAITGLPPIL